MSTTMTMDQLLDRLMVFSQKTLEWCAQESEQSTSRVMLAIDVLLKNTQRVSQISKESLEALQGLQKAITIQMNDRNRESLTSLIKNLEELAKQHGEVQEVIHPIIQALQFQDKLRQNLENILKMLPVWIAYRQGLPSHMNYEKLIDFGRLIAKQTTMISERDVIRAYIDGLPPEQDVQAVVMF